MNTDTKSQATAAQDSQEKMQNEFSLGDQETKVDKPKFKYMKTGFVEAVAEFLRLDSTLTKNAVAQKGDKHFDRYSDELIAIRDAIGPPEKNKQIPEDQRTEVLDLIRCSSAAKPLLFLANRLWGIDLKKDALKAIGENQSTALKPPQTQRGNNEADSHGDTLKVLLEQHDEDKQLSEAQMKDLINSLALGTKQAQAQSRTYLSSMLYIGAALIFFRFQCALLDKADAKALHDRLLVTLNLNFNKASKSALDATLGRIRRAYIRTLAAHLDEPEPDLKDKKALWSLYTKSIQDIPNLVDRYFSGDLNDSYLAGIPYLPPIQGKRKETKSKEPPEWAPHIKNLKSLFEATDPGSNNNTKFDGGFVDATMFGLERLTMILAKQDPSTLLACRQTIEEQIVCLESLIVHDA